MSKLDLLNNIRKTDIKEDDQVDFIGHKFNNINDEETDDGVTVSDVNPKEDSEFMSTLSSKINSLNFGKNEEDKKAEEDKAEAERIEAEKKAKEEVDRIEAEKKAEAEKIKAEEEAKAEAKRIEVEKAKEEAERIESQRIEAEKKAKEEADRAKAESERIEAERIRLEAEKDEAEKKAKESARAEEEKIEAERPKKEAEKKENGETICESTSNLSSIDRNIVMYMIDNNSEARDKINKSLTILDEEDITGLINIVKNFVNNGSNITIDKISKKCIITILNIFNENSYNFKEVNMFAAKEDIDNLYKIISNKFC